MALSLCKPPRPVSFTGNVVHNWQGFEEQLTWFLAGTELSEKSDSVKIGIMLMHTGKEAWEYFPGLMTKWNSTRLSKPSGNTANRVRTFFMNSINSAILNKRKVNQLMFIARDSKSRLTTATIREGWPETVKIEMMREICVWDSRWQS